MKVAQLPSRLRLLLSVCFLALTLQSCQKESDDIAPTAVDSQSNDCRWPRRGRGHGRHINVPDACQQVSLVANRNTEVGKVAVGMDGNNAVVTYTVTKPGVYLTEVNMDVFSTLQRFYAVGKLGYNGARASQFVFQRNFSRSSRTTSFSFSIPAWYLHLLGGADCFNIAANAELSDGSNAWAGLSRPTSNGRVSLDVAKQFPGCDWSVYFEFCKSTCNEGVDFTYAWEDLSSSANDADYNDLVVQSDVVKSATEMKINFLLTARGASFEHKFRFKIPKAGITGVFGAPSYTEDATHYYITVFESTAAAFPSGYANVALGIPCAPFASAEVVLTLDNSFTYNPAAPYEPYLTIFYPGDSNPVRDLYIYEVSGRDTWTAIDGKEYPNGILIPFDWRWPLEGMNIRLAYPNFTSITEGFTPTWANNLADDTKTFDKTVCQ